MSTCHLGLSWLLKPHSFSGFSTKTFGNFGMTITGDVLKYGVTDHELDAITAAIVGRLYLKNKTISIGKKEEGLTPARALEA